ncbi:Septum formation initiator [Daejeonella rubra]|uniref:Septum formation initiator n=1 Tax=Daejeonella rubra TaxID=990371 RepID=A0A1G9TMV2_9SPHI|nr:septum formation initiator [Daejeonella rubra]SDM49077.1 Septum formation initiator [Daejeonella rubra]
MTRILDLIRNKYLIAGVAFLTWMLFFDRNDLMSQYEYRTQLNKLEAEKEFYTFESAKAVKDLNELTTNQSKLEKFAREKYLMKKENEDVFVIIQEEAKKEEKSSIFGN